MAYTSAYPPSYAPGARAQRKTSLPEAALYSSAPRLDVFDQQPYPSYQPVHSQAPYATPEQMSHRAEQFHYAHHASVNPHESPDHLSGFMCSSQWEHGAEDDVPTISVDHGFGDIFSTGAYSPPPATPSEDGRSPVSVDMGFWASDFSMGNGPFGSVSTDAASSPAMSDTGLYADGFAPPHGAFLQTPLGHTRQRSSSEPNLAMSFHNNAAAGLLIPQELPGQFLAQPMFTSPTSDNTPTESQQFMLPPASAPPAARLRRAASLSDRAQAAHRHTLAHPAAATPDYLSPDFTPDYHTLPPAHGATRSHSLGSSRATSPYSRSASPYSRGTSPSGSEYADALVVTPGGEPPLGAIAKQVVTTGPVAEASASRRTHAAKFRCDICGVALTTKTNLEGHRKSHLGLKEHQCSICDKSFTRDWDRKRHEKTHAKAELHCKLCGKTSSRKDAFDKHRCRVRDDDFYPVPV